MKQTKSSSKSQTDLKFERQDFDLFGAIDNIDKKNYSWYSSLSEEQQRKFTAYMLVHWISSVSGKSELSRYYVLSTEYHANKYLFNETIQNHPELQFLLLCAASPGLGKQYHQWIPHLSPKIKELRESATLKEISDYLRKIYKNADDDTISSYAQELTRIQNHQYKLANICPELKLDDIAVLSTITTEQDIIRYEEESGIV